MTEIPEHLLKRSRERRSALGLGGDDGGSGDSAPAASASPATTTSTTPAAATPAAPAGRAAKPAPAAPPPPKPDTYVVAAYKRRMKIPFWAMLALSLLPIWAFMYARAVTTQVVAAAGPLAVGEQTYGQCASCHGATGGPGNIGYPFADGEVLLTFPNIEDQLRFVYYGTALYNAAGVEIYGDPEREGGPHVTGARSVMPNQGSGTGGALTDEELLAVVCHERYTLGGADEGGDYAEEYEKWCSAESEIFTDIEGGGDIRTVDERFEGIIPIGMNPVPGSPAAEE